MQVGELRIQQMSHFFGIHSETEVSNPVRGLGAIATQTSSKNRRKNERERVDKNV